jgi:hypothetical protein
MVQRRYRFAGRGTYLCSPSPPVNLANPEIVMKNEGRGTDPDGRFGSGCTCRPRPDVPQRLHDSCRLLAVPIPFDTPVRLLITGVRVTLTDGGGKAVPAGGGIHQVSLASGGASALAVSYSVSGVLP